MNDVKLTPMMQQYKDAKNEIPHDAILLFRLGDFYEMFFDDAKLVSKVANLTCTQRGGYPMAGFPYHSLDTHLPKLLEAGLKVAIAEQVEDPKMAQGIVKREITRIITPGTVTDGSVLSPGQNNFLVALIENKEKFGLSCLDISTGEFKITELKNISDLETELHRLNTRECLIPQDLYDRWEAENRFPYTVCKILWTPLDDWIFDLETANELLKRHFEVASLDGFGCRGFDTAVRAAGAVMHYATENLRQSAGHLKKISVYHNEEFMELDFTTQRNLELVEPMMGKARENTLLHVLNETVTPMGGRLLREWLLRPLYNLQKIVERHDAVDAFKDDPLTLAEIRELVAGIRDLERIIARLNIGSANARDMLALSNSLRIIPDLKYLLGNFDTPLIRHLDVSLAEMPELMDKIAGAISDDPPNTLTDGGFIREGYDAALDELRSASTEGKNWLADIQRKEQERTGIKSLKIKYNKVFGYYIEISNSNLSLVPEDYMRKQTLVNAERFITPELKEIESKILGSEEKSKALEYELFQQLREFALQFTAQIQDTACALAAIDVLAGLAECARKYNYIRPHMTENDVIDIKAGRHPVLDAQMQGERFVPNDTLLDGEYNRMMIITGPNMAGKSTYIRQTAMLVIQAQMGSFVPADHAGIGLVDRVFTRVGASDDISRGQSTFMVEMVETANILNNATPKSLVILDEIGRGTSTFDGLSIAWAVAEYLHDSPKSCARTQFATHYHELTEMALTHKGVKNYNVAVREYDNQVIFLRQIIPGGTDKSYGIHVAKLAGLPEEVINRANEILENLENNSLAEAGEPALAVHHVKDKKRRYKASAPDKTAKADEPETIQPGLFD
ncbi:MAG: DNA mismatch repair protein MutS [Victivallales bacterium]|nr:DNA mismatch repair protein MutS [Victivallales bacterium]